MPISHKAFCLDFEMTDPWLVTTLRRVLFLIVLTGLLVTFGVSGYILVEHFTFLEALYMTVITLATVGFAEVRPLNDAGRIFTIVLILTGAGFLTYSLIYFSQVIVDQNLIELYRRRRLKKQLGQLEDHYIVCGYGQMGQIIVQELMTHNIPVVVLDTDESLVIRFREKGILHLTADATEEENLVAAGIQRAKGLVAVVNRDTDNVFIVLTARDLNRDLLIFARAGSPSTHKRLLKAGANRVVSPFATGARHIAQNVLRPTVTDFLELALSAEGLELSLEEIVIPDDAELVGKELMHSGIRYQYNLIVVAIKRRDGTMIYNPSPQELFEAGDILIAIGPQENLLSFSREIGGTLQSAS
jgi:voltage-gated potassium channel